MADKPIGNMKFGIGVEGVDNTIKTLDQLQSKMRQAESAMRANAKAFDDGGKSMQGLSQKTKDLNTVMGLEEQKIKILQKRRDEAIQKYGAESKQVDNLNTKINQSTAKYNAYNQQLSKTTTALEKQLVSSSKYGKQVEANNKATEKEVAIAKKHGTEIDVVKAKQEGQRRNLEIMNKAVKEQSNEVTQLTKKYGANSTEVKEAQQKLQAYANEARKSEKNVDALGNELKETEKAMKGVSTESKEASSNASKLDGVFSSLKKTASGVGSSIKSGFGKIGSAIGSATKGVGIFLGAGALGAVANVGSKAFNTVKSSIDGALNRIDTLNNSTRAFENMGVATGDITKNMDKLQEATRGLPTALDSAVSNVQLLTASTDDMGLSVDVFKAMNDAILGFGGDAQMVDSAVVQLSQSFSNGKVDAQTWNSMINSGLGPTLNALAKEMGITTGALKDGLSSGSVSVKDFQDALVKMDKEGGGGLKSLEKIAKDSTQGFGTAIANMKSAVTRGTAKMIEGLNKSLEKMGLPTFQEQITNTGKKFEAFLGGLGNSLPELAKNLSWVGKLFKGTFDVFGGVFGEAWKQATEFGDKIGKWVGALGESFKTGDILSLNKLGLAPEQVIDLWTAIDNLKGAFDRLKNMVEAIKESFKTGDILSLNKLGLSNEQVIDIWNSIDGIKESFGRFTDYIKNAFNFGTGDGTPTGFFNTLTNVINFVVEKVIPTLLPLIDKALKAITKLLGGAQKIFKSVLDFFVKELLPMIMPIIQDLAKELGKIFDKISNWWDKNGDRIGQAIMNLLKLLKPIFAIAIEIVKSFVKSVVGFIDGMVDVITGIIDVFSMVLTGDFTGLWDAIKRIFFGGIKAVWEWFNIMFIGKIFKGVKGLGSSVSGTIKGMWDAVKNFFTSGGSSAGALFDRFGGSIKGIATNFKNAISNTVSNMWNGVKNFFSSGANGAKNIFDGFKNGISSIANGMKNAVSNTIGNLWNGIKNTFSNGIKTVSGWFSDLPNQMVRAVKNGAGAITNAFKGIFNGVLRAIGGPVNGIIGGANWVLEKFGAPQVSKWNVPQYEQGTSSGGHVGGPMVVNDGGGAEMVITPDGNAMIPKGRNVMMNAPKGTHVLNEHETSALLGKRGRVPFYKKGTGFMDGVKDMWSNTKSFVGNGINKVKETIGDIMDWVGKPLDLARNAIMGAMDLGGLSHIPLDMAKGLGGKATNAFAEKVKALFKKKEEEESAGAGGDWAPVIRKAAKYMGQSISSSQVAGLVAQIMRESGGNEKIVQSPDVVDVNTLSGNPARGLLQYIPQTFDAYKVPGHGNINNGYHQLLAFFNNSNWENDLQYGKSGWGPRGHRIRGYFNGGIAKNPQIATLAENGYPEVIIPTEPSKRGRAMALLNQAKQMLGVKDERNHVGGSSESQDIALLVGLMQQQNELLQAILDKKIDVLLDGKKMNKELNSINTTQQRNSRRNLGFI
ncbi:tape measure protein [Enterococcus faecalis]|uniref:tape measure protein n=1 Tax=Enterococcus faecalis TaxID=1351 RepID=UPI001F064A54|nr:tape measure protein [Enterococcus faecalis]MCH1677447.1 tape measure protein [Enterococcus faecalis]MCH1680239.1 tape measure protein [Enterococcus faecalis]